MSSPLPTRLNPSNMGTRIRYTILHREETETHFDNFSFGCLRIDDSTYERDVVIDRGEIRDRKKRPSQKFRDDFGAHATVHRGGHTLEMPPTRHRYRCIAGHERSR